MNQFLTDPKEVKAWLDEMGVEHYEIREDGVVDIIYDRPRHYAVMLNNKSIIRLPVQFGIVQACFDIDSSELVTLAGCPIRVDGYFSCQGNKELTTLDHCPMQIGEDFYIKNGNLTGGLLRIFIIEALKDILFDGSVPDVVIDIIEKHLPTKDIFACQQELIDAGYEELATL